MKYVWIIGGILVLAMLIVIAIGYALPVTHRATATTTVNAPPDQVFALITNVAAFPSWRTGVDSVEVLPSDNQLRFREKGSDGVITYVVERQEPNRSVVTRIDDKSLPFGGTWTFALAPEADNRTSLTITEDGEVYNPLFRFVSRFVMGHDATIKRYLGDVSGKLGS